MRQLLLLQLLEEQISVSHTSGPERLVEGEGESATTLAGCGVRLMPRKGVLSPLAHKKA